MNETTTASPQALPRGVMLNAYPDSIGERLADTVALLRRPEFEGAFSLFYILPTLFNSDLDRGFSVIDYELNRELVSPADLAGLAELGVQVKLDLVLNHLSVRSPQFQDLLAHGTESRYRDFFVDWDAFWRDHGETDADGHVMPHREHLEKLFMRKPGLPVLRVRFPDGSLRAYWNTFYQRVEFDGITVDDLAAIEGLEPDAAQVIAEQASAAIHAKGFLDGRDLAPFGDHANAVVRAVCHKRRYLGQMDLNARSDQVWTFYDETLAKLRGYGARIVRLDAFAYLHKAPGEPNFFNRPGTWDYLRRLRDMARRHALVVFPEIHAEYGAGLHEEISAEGYPVYDFFLPGLLIDALDRGSGAALKRWIGEILARGLQTINMLGCHDGIPVLDLRGKTVDGIHRPGLLSDAHIEAAVERVMARGGVVKNLYGVDGRRIDYYQVNASYFSALGEDPNRLCLARAIQMFMPGVPQVWYLDLFAGSNDHAAVAASPTAGHKEINRTNLSLDEIERRLREPVVRDQLALIRLRNRSQAFEGDLDLADTDDHRLRMRWTHPAQALELDADLRAHRFTVARVDGGRREILVAGGG